MSIERRINETVLRFQRSGQKVRHIILSPDDALEYARARRKRNPKEKHNPVIGRYSSPEGEIEIRLGAKSMAYSEIGTKRSVRKEQGWKR